MGEAEGVLAGELGPLRLDELRADQAQDGRLQPGPLVVGEELAQRADVEGASLDRGPARAARARPGSSRSMRAASTAWRLGGRPSPPSSIPAATSCSRKSGLPSARVTMRSDAPRSSSSARAADERAGLRVRERLERHQRPPGLRRRPRGPLVQELGAGEAEQQDRGAAREGHQVLEQVEQRRLGPVDVLDDRDQGALARDALEQPADGPGRLLDRGGLVGRARSRRTPAARPIRPGRRPPRSRRRIAAAELADHLGQRAVGEPVAVGEAAAHDDRRPVADLGRELAREARLAEARRRRRP